MKTIPLIGLSRSTIRAAVPVLLVDADRTYSMSGINPAASCIACASGPQPTQTARDCTVLICI